MNLEQLRELVIRPSLQHINLWSPAAENLVLGTALVESKAEYVHQVNGPALGLWQMEPATHDDIWINWLQYNATIREALKELMTPAEITRGANELIGNLYYGAAMCRIHYERARITVEGKRVQAPIPQEKDADAMARFWKAHYNTSKGAGTVEKALPRFIVVCA